MDVGIDTSFPCPNRPKCIGQALLSGVSAPAGARRLPPRAWRSRVSARLPAVARGWEAVFVLLREIAALQTLWI
jgi:hypothetical protein